MPSKLGAVVLSQREMTEMTSGRNSAGERLKGSNGGMATLTTSRCPDLFLGRARMTLIRCVTPSKEP